MKLSEYQHQLEESKEYTTAKNDLQVKFSLADAVYNARTRKGWSQKELAKAIGTKQANISRIESGLANPTLEFLNRLSNVLDFKIEFSCEKESAIEFISEQTEKTLTASYITAIPIESLAFDLSSNKSKTRETKVFA